MEKIESQKILIVTSNLYKAEKIYEYLVNFITSKNIVLFPNDELLRSETLAESKEMSSSRLYALNEIVSNRADVVITNLSACSLYLPQKEEFEKRIFSCKVGDKIKIEDLIQTLVHNGYQRVKRIDQSFEYAIRGDIVDVFSINEQDPIRIEFFEDEIESIRHFDIATQQSKDKINNITILPANEFILTQKEYKNAKDKILDALENTKSSLSVTTFENAYENVTRDIECIQSNNISPRILRYYSLLLDSPCSLFDYCEGFTTLLVDKSNLKSCLETLIFESETFLNELKDCGRIVTGLSLYQDITNKISKVKNTVEIKDFANDENDIILDFRPVFHCVSRTVDFLSIIDSYRNQNYKIIICVSSKERMNFIIEALHDKGVGYEMVDGYNLPTKTSIGLSFISLPSGFELLNEKIVFLTSKELFKENNNYSRFSSKFKEATIIKNFDDLQIGDYIVHEYYGIGIFQGLVQMGIDGTTRDYLKIEYQNNEFLYVALSQFQLVRKYQGKEGAKPRLTHLSTKDWEKTKERIRKKIDDLAQRLYNLYTERNKINGFAFKEEEELEKDFQDSFQYTLTKDQAVAVDEIKKDMAKPRPMDRLLCGDVGFGKTEVAFSAIFRAILNSKQAMILCPTTLLAKQHFDVAQERFAKYGIRVAILSRMVDNKKQKEYINQIKDGTIDLVVGTHRILSKDIVFKDLGLLVIDEEHRFGVEQKEKIKELKSNIDVLSLSATPIPRTLQISLLGVRSLSLINTPPKDRMPIQTYVIPYDLKIAKELIERELGRKGQVFFLHNDISTIYQLADKLSKMIPSAKISVGHGKMDKQELEKTMEEFYDGQVDVLVATTIIENGIDIPNANLLIVDDVSRYGLSQLYQIKGRVGRGDRIAYAYLMYQRGKKMTEQLEQRLKAIQEFTELGSGYKIAQRDLLIRGAGDILGPEQAGFIDSIGLDLYIKLLNESIQEKITGKKVKNVEIPTSFPLSLDSYIPDSFASKSEKIEIFQNIESISTFASLTEYKLKLIDLYGKLPDSVTLLFRKRKIDLLVHEAHVTSLKEFPELVKIELGKEYFNIPMIGTILFEALLPLMPKVKIAYKDNIFTLTLYKQAEWVEDLEKMLTNITNILKNS